MLLTAITCETLTDEKEIVIHLECPQRIWQNVLSWGFIIFSQPVRMYRKSYCTTPGIGIGGGVGVDKMFKFYVKVFM